MHLLPWNNPLVGTAFMLRNRRGNLMTTVSLYIVLLVMAMMGWQYYVSINPVVKGNPHKVFLLILFSLQCFISGILMLGQAGSSLKNEVLNKTLDFQRIAATAPWDILLGKLLGVPVMSYLLAISAMPVAVFVLLSGVSGVGIIDLLLIWLQMLTFLFLLGSCAIQNTLQITTSRGTGAAPGFGIFMAFMGLMTYVSFAPGDSSSYLADPRRMSLGALISPLTAYAGIAAENPWLARFYWFNLEIPCLLFTPVAHLVIAWLVLSIMARRLENIDNTPLGKRKGYFFLGLVDLILVGVLHSSGIGGKALGAAGLSVQQQLAYFLMLHSLVSFVFFVTVTPRSDFIQSWIWRFRRPGAMAADSLLHDRAPNFVSILISLLTGLAGMLTIVLFAQSPVPEYELLLNAGLTTGTVILFLGLLYQAAHLFFGKSASGYFGLIIAVLWIIPLITGAVLRQPGIPAYQPWGVALLHATPFTQYLQWIVPANDKLFTSISPLPVVIGYLLLAGMVFYFTLLWIQRKAARIEATRHRITFIESNVQPSS